MESSLMWDAYTPFKNGIRLKISFENLLKVLRAQPELDIKRFKYKRVEYVKYKDFQSRLDNDAALQRIYMNQNQTILEYLFVKRREYKDEREFRVIYDANHTKFENDNILNISIEPNELIDQIRFDPKMPDNDCETLTKYFGNKGFDKRKIVRSLLYKYQIKKKVRLIKIKI